jgi:hypothetical protein
MTQIHTSAWLSEALFNIIISRVVFKAKKKGQTKDSSGPAFDYLRHWFQFCLYRFSRISTILSVFGSFNKRRNKPLIMTLMLGIYRLSG